MNLNETSARLCGIQQLITQVGGTDSRQVALLLGTRKRELWMTLALPVRSQHGVNSNHWLSQRHTIIGRKSGSFRAHQKSPVRLGLRLQRFPNSFFIHNHRPHLVNITSSICLTSMADSRRQDGDRPSRTLDQHPK